MNDIKIEDLRINQTVWLAGEKYKIKTLYNLDVLELEGLYGQINVCDISLTPTPEKRTKRFWLWSYKEDKNEQWEKCNIYMDDIGKDTNNEEYISHKQKPFEWFDTKKHENEFIDVEVDW